VKRWGHKIKLRRKKKEEREREREGTVEEKLHLVPLVEDSTSSWTFSTSIFKCVHPLWISPCNLPSKVGHEYYYLRLSILTLSIICTASSGWCLVFNVSSDDQPSTWGSTCKSRCFKGEKLHILHSHIQDTTILIIV